MQQQFNRSPLFYVGDKYKLLKQIIPLFPEKIDTFYEPFVGGGSVFLNIKANKYILNDLNKYLISIHKFLQSSSSDINKFFDTVFDIIKKYNLSCSCVKDIVPLQLKKEYKKTYYAKFNKNGYEKLKNFINNNNLNSPVILYILIIYGFNRMLRFNSAGQFNLPVGNVDFNKNVNDALLNYFSFVKDKKIYFNNNDFFHFLKKYNFKQNDFIYIDPPYLITNSEYNKNWTEWEEKKLLDYLDILSNKKIKFALSNVTHYKNLKNLMLIKWCNKYSVHNIKSNYINYYNNSKKNINEILVTNY